MDRCRKQPGWYAYFSENMNDLGLDVPSSWFGGSTKVTAYLAALVAIAEKFGSRVTIGEVLKAGTRGEALLVIGAGYASWYLGAAIGSAAVATGRHMAGGTRIIDVLGYAARNRMLTPTIARRLLAHPEIYDATKRWRRGYAGLARAWA